MSTDNLIWLFVWLLPSVIVLGLGFVAASDKKTRQRWSDLLYQLGSVRHDQRDDPKVQSGVRWPFLIVSLILLVFPIRHYLHATRKFEISPSAYGKADQSAPAFNPYGGTGNAAGNSATTGNSAGNAAPGYGSASNTVAPPPAAPFSPYGAAPPR